MKTLIKHSISEKLSETLIKAAIKKADELSVKISITITDESGVLKAFHRMDNAPLISIDASRKKAITAIGFGMPSGEPWFNFIKDDPILREGVSNFTDFILLGGGSPIILNEAIIGAMGISGGHYKQDEECVNYALSQIQ